MQPAATTRDPDKAAHYARQRIAFWEDYSRNVARWDRFRRGYQRRLRDIYALAIPPGSSVLELGSGTGDLLAATEPALGVGVDFAPSLVRLAQQRHPRGGHPEPHLRDALHREVRGPGTGYSVPRPEGTRTALPVPGPAPVQLGLVYQF